MAATAFLDTGSILGFCFVPDPHHEKCRGYIEDHGGALAYSSRVEEEYSNKRDQLSTRYADGVRHHIQSLKQSSLEKKLDPRDIKHIRENLLNATGSDANPSARFLHDYYEQKVPKYIEFDELIAKLVEIQRGIEKLALRRKNTLDSEALVWSRFRSYEELYGALSFIDGERDTEICIDAHDLAVEIDDDVLFVTNNPTDFVFRGYKERILDETALADVHSVAYLRSQEDIDAQ